MEQNYRRLRFILAVDNILLNIFPQILDSTKSLSQLVGQTFIVEMVLHISVLLGGGLLRQVVPHMKQQLHMVLASLMLWPVM